MKKIYLNILGLKNFETGDLVKLRDEIETLSPTYSSILYEPIRELKRKIQIVLRKREVSKSVWVEFVTVWSGYSNPASQGQRREVGRFYRKIERQKALSLPKYFVHSFTDGTTNDWSVKIVDIRGKDSGSYSSQIDEFLSSHQG